jgi:hypothetical protein
MRNNAADQLEGARKIYAEIAGDKKLPDALTQESLGQLARIEEVLAAVPKKEGGGMRGSLDEAVRRYEELKQRFPDLPAGEEAAKRAAEIKAKKAEIEKLYAELSQAPAANAAPTTPVGVQPELPPR